MLLIKWYALLSGGDGERVSYGAGFDAGVMMREGQSDIEVVAVADEPLMVDYREAMAQADIIAAERLGDFMLLSWYDRDRDFESPQHSSECHLDSATPGYVDYGIHHGATLKVDIGEGRFVFFYLPVDFQ